MSCNGRHKPGNLVRCFKNARCRCLTIFLTNSLRWSLSDKFKNENEKQLPSVLAKTLFNLPYTTRHNARKILNKTVFEKVFFLMRTGISWRDIQFIKVLLEIINTSGSGINMRFSKMHGRSCLRSTRLRVCQRMQHISPTCTSTRQ
jgi:hypothetical protein